MDVKSVQDTFSLLGVDERGLLPIDREYLSKLSHDRAIGLNALSAMLSIDSETIQEEVEPYLLQMGLIDRTPRGRILL